MIRVLLAVVFVMLLPSSMHAAPQRTIHLYGDSISRGYGLGGFSDLIPTDHPLYLLRSPASMIESVFSDNGITDSVRYAGDLFIGGIEQTDRLEQDWDSGLIRVGDILVFEDAGPAAMPDDYEQQWRALRAVATEYHPVTLLMLEMFDFPPAPEDSQYATALGLSERTRNQASAAAAAAQMPYVGQTLRVHLRDTMVQARSSARVYDQVDLILPDGIHPNVWGQMLLVGEVLKAAGYSPLIHSVASLQALAEANWYILAGTSPTFTPYRARQYVEWLLRR